MKRIVIYIFILLCSSSSAWAQDCEEELDKKTQKAISTAMYKKTTMGERFELMRSAVDNDDNCLRCKFILGELSFEHAKRNANGSFRSAQRMFEGLKTQCPDYHADIYYYLGSIYYSQAAWKESSAAFNAFLEFGVDDPSKISQEHTSRRRDAKDVLEEVEFNVELFENPAEFNPVRINGVSSPTDEYLPMLSPDNEKMYFTRKIKKQGKSILDNYEKEEFTVSKRTSISAEFDSGKPLPSPFNLGDAYGGSTMSVDNKEMYVTVCKPSGGGRKNCDIYRATAIMTVNKATGKQEVGWSELENLGPAVNSDGWESQPSLSSDGKTLFFATARANSTETADGRGNSIDIFMTERGPNGKWGPAKSIGPVINTPGNEKSPFMHGDSRTLYFAANGLAGVGGYDIYFSRLDDNGRWSTPKNIGVPINTADDEHGLIVATDGSRAYYATGKVQGSQGLDIYGFELPERAKPEKVLLVRGSVKDENGTVVEDARIELNFLESKKVQRLKVDQEDGSYATIVNVEREPVVMTVKSEEHAFEAQLLTEEQADEGLIAEVDMQLNTVEVGKPYAINDINYATSSSDIDEDSKPVLQMFAVYLADHPGMRIAIHGHTDNVGNQDENMTLSTERAFEVMKYLQENGVSADIMSFKGFGQTKPIADNSTENGRSENRRTEFVITSK